MTSNVVRKVQWSSESVYLGSSWGPGECGQQLDPGVGAVGLERLHLSSLPTAQAQ